MLGEQYRLMRPGLDEYAQFYHKYVARVPDGDICTTLACQRTESTDLLADLTEEQAVFSYALGKWTIKQLLGHVIDAERVFAYRALRIGRNDPTPLPGFDENLYAAQAASNDRKLADILTEFQHVRTATLDLLSSINEEAWLRRGIASGFPVSVRGIAWIIAGHELHHRSILQERYLAR